MPERTVAKKRIFSGMQPSGEAHLGNYLGALRRWARMQDAYDCVWCIVDEHAITAGSDPRDMPQKVLDLAISYLAVGLDPERAIIFVQSDVKEHTELAWLLNAVTPVGDLERMTQYKDKSSRFTSIPAGILNYPILQAADILLYKTDGVPVGEDQRQHLELSREIARRFNAAYGKTFPIIEPLVDRTVGRVLGLDGSSKMSKSLGNTVGILAEPDEIRDRVRTAVTDPQRVRRSDPGRPEVCNVYTLHGFFTGEQRRGEIAEACRKAEMGCVECKGMLANAVSSSLEPYRACARAYRRRPSLVKDVLIDGAARAQAIASRTIDEVRGKMGLEWRNAVTSGTPQAEPGTISSEKASS